MEGQRQMPPKYEKLPPNIMNKWWLDHNEEIPSQSKSAQ
jgi:hypothetical protein